MKPSGRLADVDAMIDAGLARLKALRHADGGFGWWEHDASDPYMTAYVVHGLSRVLTVRADPAAEDIQRGAATWLARWRGGARAGDGSRAEGGRQITLEAFVLMALADARALDPASLGAAVGDGVTSTPSLARAFQLRTAKTLGRDDDVRVHLASLAARAVSDDSGVRFEGEAQGAAGAWAGDSIETTAWALGALLAADPAHALIDGGVRWLLSRRVDGARWQSTRDTAACVAFLTRRAAARGSAGAGRTVRLSVNGLRLRPITITDQNAFSDAGTLVLEAPDLPAAAIEIRAEPESGSLDVSAALRFTDAGPAIEASTAGLRVERVFWLVEPLAGSGTFRRTRVTETVPSGARLDVDVTVTVPAVTEFVMIESPHAAGFEPERETPLTFDVPIAEATPSDHVDRRDDRTVFFQGRLAAGTHVFRHRVRATHAGTFTVLPASAEAMYAPAIRGNAKGEVLEISIAGFAARPEGSK